MNLIIKKALFFYFLIFSFIGNLYAESVLKTYGDIEALAKKNSLSLAEAGLLKSAFESFGKPRKKEIREFWGFCDLASGANERLIFSSTSPEKDNPGYLDTIEFYLCGIDNNKFFKKKITATTYKRVFGWGYLNLITFPDTKKQLILFAFGGDFHGFSIVGGELKEVLTCPGDGTQLYGYSVGGEHPDCSTYVLPAFNKELKIINECSAEPVGSFSEEDYKWNAEHGNYELVAEHKKISFLEALLIAYGSKEFYDGMKEEALRPVNQKALSEFLKKSKSDLAKKHVSQFLKSLRNDEKSKSL